jgi:hypothetical protein
MHLVIVRKYEEDDCFARSRYNRNRMLNTVVDDVHRCEEDVLVRGPFTQPRKNIILVYLTMPEEC